MHVITIGEENSYVHLTQPRWRRRLESVAATPGFEVGSQVFSLDEHHHRRLPIGASASRRPRPRRRLHGSHRRSDPRHRALSNSNKSAISNLMLCVYHERKDKLNGIHSHSFQQPFFYFIVPGSEPNKEITATSLPLPFPSFPKNFPLFLFFLQLIFFLQSK